MNIENGVIAIRVDGYEVKIENIEKNHSENVCALTKILFDHLGITDYGWLSAALLHDVGKKFSAKSVLNNPNELSKDEYSHIKEHTRNGYIMIMYSDVSDDVKYKCAKTCLLHHEREDGNGYWKETKIPDEIKWISLVDVYDAIRSERCYSPSIPHDEAIEIIRSGKPGYFDPNKIDLIDKLFVNYPYETNEAVNIAVNIATYGLDSCQEV